MFVWRPERALDFSSTEVTFGSQKIKKQKLVGIPQDIMNIQYQRKTNRYYINGISPFDTVDEIRNKKPNVITPNTEFDEVPF